MRRFRLDMFGVSTAGVDRDADRITIMPAPKRGPEEVTMTVRTAPRHRRVVDAIAAKYGLSRSDAAAIVLADALELERPPGKPVVSLTLAEARAIAREVISATNREEVLPETA